jgi:hypothetical protein
VVLDAAKSANYLITAFGGEIMRTIFAAEPPSFMLNSSDAIR